VHYVTPPVNLTDPASSVDDWLPNPYENLGSEKVAIVTRSCRMRTLRSKLISLAFILQLLALIFFLLGMNHVLRNSLAENFAVTAREEGEIINLALAPYLTQGRSSEVQEYFDEMLGASDIRSHLNYLVVRSGSGKLVLAAGKSPAGDWPMPSSNALEAFANGIYHVRQPVLLAGNEVGQLQFGVVTDLLSELMRRVTLMAVMVSAAVLALAGMIFFFGSARLNRRLLRLVAAHEALAAGDYAARASDSGDDELGRLTLHFNAMADRIADQMTVLENSRAKYFGVFNGSPVAMAVTSLDGRGLTIVDVNQAWEQQFGFSRQDVVGKTDSELGLYVEQEERKALLQQVNIAGSALQDVWRSRRDGTTLLCQMAVRSLGFDSARHFVVALQDVTELRRSAQQLGEMNAGLERRVEQRTGELAEKNARLSEALVQLKNAQDYLLQSEKLTSLGAMVAAVAHELNTPIGNALMVATTLRDETGVLQKAMANGLTRSALHTYLDQAQEGHLLVERNLARASRLINSFKEVAVDRTSSNRRRFDLQEVVQEVMETLLPTLKQQPYVFNIAVPEGISCDSYPGPLGQILVNLVNNAVFHAFVGRDHGQIDISAESLPESRIRLQVRDDGVGIAPEHLSRVFDPFFTTRLGQGGSGLGLNISYNIATGLLGGQIKVYSELGKGSLFVLEFMQNAPEVDADHV
jgi:PAS domain S-box-containing protein